MALVPCSPPYFVSNLQSTKFCTKQAASFTDMNVPSLDPAEGIHLPDWGYEELKVQHQEGQQ